MDTLGTIYVGLKLGAPVIGVGGFLFGIVAFFRGLKSDLKEIKENHLFHIEQSTTQMAGDMRELLGFMKAKAEDRKI
jgi:hypothetical protein